MNESFGTCPVCNGVAQLPLTDYDKQWSWNKDRTHKACYNCGGQYQWGQPTGEVRLNKDGIPCKHEYKEKNVGRCLNDYTCIHCGDLHQIDSGD